MMQSQIVPVVVQQHVEDAAVLHNTRSLLSVAPHVRLLHLRRFDDRMAAHLDGLAVAGNDGWPICEAALERPESGAMFTAAVRAIEDRRVDLLDRVFTLAQSALGGQSGLRSALGWVEPQALRGMVFDLLGSIDPFRRLLAIAASAMHRVDPSLGAARRLEDPDALCRARVYRAAGELGKREFLPYLARTLSDPDPVCQFWAAWSAVLLGDRQQALHQLQTYASADNPFRERAFRLSLLATSSERRHEQLRSFAQDAAHMRWLIKGAGLVGDPTYIPWLIKHMSDDKLARVAGESFSLITGADLAWLDLECKPPENFESGPNDDPNDVNVEMDEDDGLPWPHQQLVERWWSINGSRFTPGVRFFVGGPVTREHCIEVLRSGYQRQRILAAHHLCLLEPGATLFEWRAPAWRQAGLLREMQ